MLNRIQQTRQYLHRRRLVECPLTPKVSSRLGIVVVIPCHDEPDPLATLNSLLACESPRCAVEVLMVINASAADEDAIRERNGESIRAIAAWREAHEHPDFRVHVLDFPYEDPRHAGVGLARKLGMDAAVDRFLHTGNADGIIASLDADCVVDESYLAALEGHFSRYPPAGACTIYFEHPLEGPGDPALYRAAARYELFLRYYRHGLRHAGFPHDHYTIGSCMAVRCETYARHGGMNRRQAGEDFYFLNKLMITGNVSEIRSTRVVPGVRVSARTPFGTGRALATQIGRGDETWETYAPEVFEDLGKLVRCVPLLWDHPDDITGTLTSLPAGARAFLESQDFVSRHREIVANTTTRDAYMKRLFRWLDAFRALKLIHHLTREHHPRRPLGEACVTLLSRQGEMFSSEKNRPELELLEIFRARDRLDTPEAGVRLLAV